MKSSVDYSIYLCTDRDLMSTETLEEAVELSIKGGCTVIQLREKNCSSKEFYDIALKIKKITDKYNIPLIINDRVDIAIAVDASGVHIGQSDLPVDIVRNIIGEEKILGVSTSNLEEAILAVKDGADYIGVGAMYPTNTKTDTKKVSISELEKIRASVNIPIVVIGGINKSTINDFDGLGIDGIAVISAIISQDDIKASTIELSSMFKNLKKKEA